MKRIVLAVLFLMAAQIASAQDWAQAKLEKSPRHHEWIMVKHDGRTVATFVAYPEAKDKRPVVLIIHEIFGMTDWVQDLADQVAAAGYIAVAPDLLSGMGPDGGRSTAFTQEQAVEAVSKLNPDQVTSDLAAAADAGVKLPSSNGKLYVAGFCWVAANLSVSPPIARISRRLLFSMGLRRKRMRSLGSRRLSMDSSQATTRGLAPRFPARLKK